MLTLSFQEGKKTTTQPPYLAHTKLSSVGTPRAMGVMVRSDCMPGGTCAVWRSPARTDTLMGGGASSGVPSESAVTTERCQPPTKWQSFSAGVPPILNVTPLGWVAVQCLPGLGAKPA